MKRELAESGDVKILIPVSICFSNKPPLATIEF